MTNLGRPARSYRAGAASWGINSEQRSRPNTVKLTIRTILSSLLLGSLLLNGPTPGEVAGAPTQLQVSSRLNPGIEKILNEISATRIEATMRKLVGFGTRHTLGPTDDPQRGIGAARRWIREEFERYSRE